MNELIRPIHTFCKVKFGFYYYMVKQSQMILRAYGVTSNLIGTLASSIHNCPGHILQKGLPSNVSFFVFFYNAVQWRSCVFLYHVVPNFRH